MNKHTPGPWESDGLLVLHAKGVRKVCMMSGASLDWEENRDNRNLVVAAPDTLEALKKAEVALAVAASYVNTEQQFMRTTLEFVRDAIAKARGTND